MKRRRSGAEVEPVGGVIREWLGRFKRDSRLAVYALREKWPDLVSDRVARNSVPLSLKQGTLLVGVSNNTWLNELSLLSSELLPRVRASNQDVNELRFVIARGGIEPPSDRRRAKGAPAKLRDPVSAGAVRAAQDRASSETDDQTVDDRLREAMVRARAVQIARKDGGRSES